MKNIEKFEFIISVLNSVNVQKDIDYIIDKLSDWEDRGYEMEVDVCSFTIMEDGGEVYMTPYSIIHNRYVTNKNDEVSEYMYKLRAPSIYQNWIHEQYTQLKSGHLCYRVVLWCDLSNIQDEINKKFGKMELLSVDGKGNSLVNIYLQARL